MSVRSFHVSRDAFHVGLAAKLSLVTDLLGDAGHLGGERVQLIDHAVDGGPDAQKFAADRTALDLEDHLLRQVSPGDGRDDARHLVGGRHKIRDELVHCRHADRPRALRRADRRALVHLAFLTDDLTHAHELPRHVLVQSEDVVQELARAAHDSVLLVFEAHRKVALLDRLQDLDEVLDFGAAARRQPVPLGCGPASGEPGLRVRAREVLVVMSVQRRPGALERPVARAVPVAVLPTLDAGGARFRAALRRARTHSRG